MPPDYLYDEYVFHWTAAVKGEDAYGEPVDADYNQDGMITMDEAFIYAEAQDSQQEEPQYGDYPEGIGETISLWPGSKPPETPTKPDGPEELIKDVEAKFSSTTTDPEGEDVYYMFDWGDGNFSEWVGPYASGGTGEASYNWSNLVEYEIKAIAKDINGVQSNWSEPHIISIVENQNPTNPEINGPTWGLGGKKYVFTFISSDPDEHDVYYKVNWDDGTNTGWIGPYSSDKEITLNHSWNKKGEYLIKAWARDMFNDESGQSNFRIKILTNVKSLQNIEGYRNLLIIKILEKMSHFSIIGHLLNR